jgi:AbrB family looped-hinge helix DNA binding protein
MVLNSKGQLTIPAHLRSKYGLHAGEEVEVVEVGGTLQIVRAEGAETRGQRLVRRPRSTATGQDVVLLDVITGDRQWADWSATQIASAMDAGRVVINPSFTPRSPSATRPSRN